VKGKKKTCIIREGVGDVDDGGEQAGWSGKGDGRRLQEKISQIRRRRSEGY